MIVERDSSNTLCLIVTIVEVPRDAPADAAPEPVYTLKCVFDNHVRCMTACQVRISQDLGWRPASGGGFSLTQPLYF